MPLVGSAELFSRNGNPAFKGAGICRLKDAPIYSFLTPLPLIKHPLTEIQAAIANGQTTA